MNRLFVLLNPRMTAGVAALLLLTLAAVGACQSTASPPHAATVLRIGFGTGAAGRAALVNNLTDLLVSEPLIGRQVDGRPIPHLAGSWRWEEGNKRVRVQLRRGIRLHNGKPLTAVLVARSLNEQVARARAAMPQAYDTVVHIGSDGQDVVVVDLARPDGLLVSELLGLRISDPDNPDIGTGPFRLLEGGPSPVTVRYEGYRDGVSALAGVNIQTYDSQRSAWAALLRGEVDAVQEVNRDSAEFLEGGTNARTYSFLQPFYIPLVFNLQHPVLQNVEVRRAIIEALDRDVIVGKAMLGRGTVADGPIWPLHWAFSAPPRRAYAPDRAIARLEAAGFPLKAAGPGAPRSRLTFRCLFWSEDPQYERIALMIQRQLFDIGINVELEPATFAQLRPRAATGDFDTFLIRTNASRALDITYRFWRSTESGSAAMQRSGYTGADRLLDALQRSTDDADVRHAVEALSHRFHEDAPAAFIAWTEITRAVHSRFVVPEAGGEDPFAKIWQWRPAAPGTPQ